MSGEQHPVIPAADPSSQPPVDDAPPDAIAGSDEPPRPVPTRRRTALKTLAVVGVGFVVLALALGLYAAFLPLGVWVDGELRPIHLGQTAGRLAAEGGFSAAPGDVVSVSGRILRSGHGGLPTFMLGERELVSSDRLWPFAVLASVRGRDVTETIVRRSVEVPPEESFIGSGTVRVVQDPGTYGVARVRLGAISGEVVETQTVTPGRPKVVRLEGLPADAPMVALTFDDGPWRGQTDKILKILKSYEVSATFFMLGKRVEVNPSLARQVVAAGHTVGSHSYSHVYLARSPASVVRREISGGQAVIERVTKFTPRWYRPAGGQTSAAVYAEAKREKIGVVNWDLDTSDYRKPPAAVIVRRVVGGTIGRRRTIVLMHDGGGDRTQTIKALPRIIQKLQARGVRIVTLDELKGR